jgi:hypothetical protein
LDFSRYVTSGRLVSRLSVDGNTCDDDDEQEKNFHFDSRAERIDSGRPYYIKVAIKPQVFAYEKHQLSSDFLKVEPLSVFHKYEDLAKTERLYR